MYRFIPILALLIAVGCKESPPEPKALYDDYRTSVVLIMTKFYHKASFNNGMDFYYNVVDGETILYDSEADAIESAQSITGTGFFISRDGKIVTNRHVAYPQEGRDEAGEFLNRKLFDLKSAIEKEIAEKNSKMSQAADIYNKYYDELSYEELSKIRDTYDQLKEETVDLESYSSLAMFNPLETELETIVTFTGIVYDDTFVNRESDFEECVLIKKSENPTTDLAIIQLKNKTTPEKIKKYFSIDDEFTNVELEDKVYMIGYNRGLNLAQTKNGIKTQFTSGTVTQDPDDDRLLYSIPTLQGSSGSPIINEWGELVAVNYAKTNDFQGFSFGVPLKKLQDLERGVEEIVAVDSAEKKSETSSEVEQVKRDLPRSGDVDYRSNIRGFIKAEDDRDFDRILAYFSSDMKRYWNINFPEMHEIEDQYDQSWELTSGSNNEIQNIIRHNSYEYTLETRFNYYNLKKKKSFTVDSKVFFRFDKNGLIEAVYGID